MSYEPPIPPTSLPTDIVDRLDRYSPDQLQDVAHYAEALAKHKAREPRREKSEKARREKSKKKDEVEDRSDDLPDDVPVKATITIKEINDNRYYYWQWREGNKVKSKYKGPVEPDE